MYEQISDILVKNIRYYLDQNWQSKGYGGTPTKKGSGPKRTRSSRLYNNIESKIEYDEYGFPTSFLIVMEDYWYWVDEGRKPGGSGPKGSNKLKDSIKQWILNKPVTWRSQDGKIPSLDSQAYLISRSIVKYGTAGTNFTELALKKTLDESLDLFGEEFAEQIEEFLGDLPIFVGKDQFNLLL